MGLIFVIPSLFCLPLLLLPPSFVAGRLRHRQLTPAAHRGSFKSMGQKTGQLREKGGKLTGRAGCNDDDVIFVNVDLLERYVAS